MPITQDLRTIRYAAYPSTLVWGLIINGLRVRNGAPAGVLARRIWTGSESVHPSRLVKPSPDHVCDLDECMHVSPMGKGLHSVATSVAPPAAACLAKLAGPTRRSVSQLAVRDRNETANKQTTAWWPGVVAAVRGYNVEEGWPCPSRGFSPDVNSAQTGSEHLADGSQTTLLPGKDADLFTNVYCLKHMRPRVCQHTISNK